MLTSHPFRENSCCSKCLFEYGRQTWRTDVKGVYVQHGWCMKFMLSKELSCSSQEELQGAFGNLAPEATVIYIKKKHIFSCASVLLLTSWETHLVQFELFYHSSPHQSLHFLLSSKDAWHQQEFLHWQQLGSGLGFPFSSSSASLSSWRNMEPYIFN